MILDAYKEKEKEFGFYNHLALQFRFLGYLQVRDPQLKGLIKDFVTDPKHSVKLMQKCRGNLFHAFINLNWQDSVELRKLFEDSMKNSYRSQIKD